MEHDGVARTAVDGLVADDLVSRIPGVVAREALPFMLTDAGRRAAALQRERRKDRLARTGQCRDAVLAWAYAHESAGRLGVRAMAATPYGWSDADQFSVEELGHAVVYLSDADLTDGGTGAFSLTAEGVACAEHYGGLVEYLTRSDRAGLSIVFTGNNNGQLAIGNRDVQQHLLQDNDAKVLGVYAQALREFAGCFPRTSVRSSPTSPRPWNVRRATRSRITAGSSP